MNDNNIQVFDSLTTPDFKAIAGEKEMNKLEIIEDLKKPINGNKIVTLNRVSNHGTYIETEEIISDDVINILSLEPIVRTRIYNFDKNDKISRVLQLSYSESPNYTSIQKYFLDWAKKSYSKEFSTMIRKAKKQENISDDRIDLLNKFKVEGLASYYSLGSTKYHDNPQRIKDSQLSTKGKIIIWSIIAVIIIGIILGYTKTITVYEDFSDLTIVFLLVFAPLGVFYSFIPMIVAYSGGNETVLQVIMLLVEIGILTWIFIRTYNSNKNILKTILALIVKLPLGIIFAYYLLYLLFPGGNNYYERRRSRSKAAIVLAVLTPLILGLVRNKVWRIKEIPKL
jgi:hypothetical protein